MNCPINSDLPKPSPGKVGWPWTEETEQLPDLMPDGSPWPLISIVTPSYNQGEFIEETIRSVLLQGYPNLEYIIIDGGSTDGSVDIIRKYEPWLSYWVSEEDRGQSHAINKGFHKSTGDILAWLNSDDYYCPNIFLKAARLWLENPNIGFIHAQTEFIDSSNESKCEIWGSKFDLFQTLKTSENKVAQPSTFISRQAILKVGFLDENLAMSLDWDLWIRIATYFQIIFVPEVWSRFRIGEHTKSSNLYYLSGKEHLWSVRKLFDNHHNSGFGICIKKTALAAAYGRYAYFTYKMGDYSKFRSLFLKSLLSNPILLGGKARNLKYKFFRL